MTEIAVLGASGRVGSRIVALARAHDCRVVSEITRQDGQLHGSPQVLIDFSVPQATRHWLQFCAHRRIPMLIGTTGLQKCDHDAIDAAAREVAVLQSANMSLGVAVLSMLARSAASILDDSDVEIVEAHHRTKKDAPSGTALTLAGALACQTGKTPSIHSLRIGDEVGRHTIYLALAGERLELTHIATSRDTFAHGALRAAKWLIAQRPARYSMSDVLGI